MVLAEVGTVSRACVQAVATKFLGGLNPRETMQVLHATGEKPAVDVLALPDNVLFARGIFQVSFRIDNCIKSEIVPACLPVTQERMTLHLSSAAGAAVAAALASPRYCKAPPVFPCANSSQGVSWRV